MKTLIASLLALSIILNSCQQYQYLTVSSENISTKSDKCEFVSDSDSVRISYNFNGNHGPVAITILNKSDKPLQIDWKKSALIIGDKPQAYYKAEWQINGEVNQFIWTNASSGTLNATAKREEGMEFLPPHTTISRVATYVKPQGYFGMPSDAVEEKIRIEGFSKKLKKGVYSKDNSPLVFRSYLTFVTGSEGQGFATDHSFYVSEIMETAVAPDLIWSEGEKKGNTFFISYSKD